MRGYVLGPALLFLVTGCSSVSMELVTFPGGRILASLPPPEPAKEEEAPSAVKITQDKISIDEKIQFESWSAEILEESHALLNEVAKVLRKNSQITKVEIHGHTAKTGQSKRSKKLSVDRAEAVRTYLVKRGVLRDRLEAKGFGDAQPIAENTSAEGREKNRRVEFVIVGQDADQMALNKKKSDGEDE